MVLVSSLPPGARVVIQRGQGGRDRNLILVTESTTVSDLRAAAGVLRQSRMQVGEETDRPLRIAIPAVPQAVPRDAVERDRLQGYLDRVLRADRGHVEGVGGTLRSISIPLEPIEHGPTQ
jgi:hypothetical protein